MTPTELHTLEALRAEMVGESGGRDGWWLTDACLCRYLRARNWDVTKVGFVPYAAHRFSGYLRFSASPGAGSRPACGIAVAGEMTLKSLHSVAVRVHPETTLLSKTSLATHPAYWIRERWQEAVGDGHGCVHIQNTSTQGLRESLQP